jgi:hypothetical protein
MVALMVGFAQVEAQSQSGWIHGTVTDVNGSRVPGIHVVVTSGRDKCESESNSEGNFNCRVSPGRYRITAMAVNIMRYQRASVQVDVNTHHYVALQVVFVAPSDQSGIENPSLHYVSKKVGDSDLMVRFNERETRDGLTIFRGKDVSLTFEDLSIYAAEISCSKFLEKCVADGRVRAELGSEKLEGSRMNLDFRDRRLVLVRDSEILRKF